MAVWINEFHYDNAGTDANEFIEIAATAGTNLSGWTIVLYNGNGGASYGTITLSGIVADAGNGVGFIRFTATGLQNGNTGGTEPDGFALVNGTTVVEFLSYEGTFTATNGVANGLTSSNVGVFENGSAGDANGSIQRTGTFQADAQPAVPGTWAVSNTANTSAARNTGQTIVPAVQPETLSISATDAVKDEGDAGTTAFTFTVTRANPDGTASATYTVSTTGGAGQADAADFSGAVTGTVSFAAGETTQTITVNVIGDGADEPDESFTVTLSSPSSGTTIAQDMATGTIQNDDGAAGLPVVTVTATDATAVEGGDEAFQFTFSRTGDPAAALTVDFSFGGTAGAADFTDALGQPVPTSITFAAGSSTAVLNLLAVDDMTVEADETVVLTLTDGTDYDLGVASDATATIDSEDVPITRISAVQGSGAASGIAGQIATIEAVIVGDFQNGDGDATRNLGGFFIQEELGDEDGLAGTSEGLFVFQGNGTAPVDYAVGDRVRVTATVTEFNGSTQLTAPTIVKIGDGAIGEVQAASVTLPNANLEAFEHMLVTLPRTVVISEQFELDRLGEIRLYTPEGDGLNGAVAESADGRAFTYTQINQPTTNGAVAAYTATIASRSIIYDDGLNGTYQPLVNPDGGGVYNTATAPQMGDSITGLTGVLDFGFSNYRIRSTVDGENDFADTNPRETAPANVGGSVKVASFNVLNFFATLDTAGTSTDIGQDPRGADTAPERDRQVEKLVTTILALDADVLGLIEIENDFSMDGADPLAEGNAVSYLVDQLNLAFGSDVFSWVNPGVDFVGSDAISNAFVYRNDVVEIAGGGTAIAIDNDPVHNRPPIAVTFEEIATGGVFTAVVNHFKSKGSGTGVNADQGDGQGASNFDRVAQANALLDFVATNPTGTTDADYILLGDFNSYFQEDPLDVLGAEGYDTLGGVTSVSYTFDGQLGSLDHIFFNTSLASQTTGSTKWHINSDEADALSYNLDADDTNPATNRDPAIFDGQTPYYVSDHDPILLGLNLTPTNKVLTGDANDNILNGRNGNDTLFGLAGEDRLIGGAGRDTLRGGDGFDRLSGGTGDDALSGEGGDDRIDGGDGIDVVDYRNETGGVVLTLNRGAETIALVGGVDQDTLLNIERVSGSQGNDELTGDAVANYLIGYIGNDVLKGGGGVDTLDGGANSDTADYSDQTAAVRVQLNGAVTVNVLVGGVREDVIRNIENLSGGSAADALYGDGLDNSLRGGGGDDVLRGNGGDDKLWGAEGNDILQGGDGIDTLSGGIGADKLGGGEGADRLDGGAGNDSLSGEAGADTFVFGRFEGVDAIRDFQSEDTIAFRALSFGLTASPGDAAPVQFGAAATGGAATFVYNAATKTVFWDSDGAGGAAAERLAILTTTDTVDASDFILI